jgi:hypothetical protein
LFATGAQAQRQPVPVINYENQPVTRVNGIWPTKDEVRQAIVRGAGAHQWTVAAAGDDNLLATLNVRGKHTVVVDIEYSPEKFSLRYRSSVNMKAAKQHGQDVIHPYYNRWVQTLLDAIRIELNKG